MTNRDPELTLAPNKYAEKNNFEIIANNKYHFYGYQNFILDLNDNKIEAISGSLQKKEAILNKIFTKKIFANRSFTDLGGNNGFFGYKAIQLGGTLANIVEIDLECVAMIEKVRVLSDAKVKGIELNVFEWNEKSDIVAALALLHWVYSCTCKFASLTKIIDWLADLCEDGLIIEWVDPADPLIQKFNHLEGSNLVNDYKFDNFMNSLKQHFKHIEYLGQMNETRQIFYACKKKVLPDLSFDMPLLFNKNTVISSTKLCEINRIPFYSRVYKYNNLIYKQTTPLLADNELLVSKYLNNKEIFYAEEQERNQNYVLLSTAFYDGLLLKDMLLQNLDISIRLKIFAELLNIVTQLKQKNIEHRDLHSGNIIISLSPLYVKIIDFGWAKIPHSVSVTPNDLGHTSFMNIISEHISSDFYALGIIAKELNINNDNDKLSFMSFLLTNISTTLTNTDIFLKIWEQLNSDNSDIFTYINNCINNFLLKNKPLEQNIVDINQIDINQVGIKFLLKELKNKILKKIN